MSITDEIRNILVDSDKFDRVYYSGNGQISIDRGHEYYIIRGIGDLTGLAVLFG